MGVTAVRIAQSALALAMATMAAIGAAAEPTATAVEFFHPALGHYFVSADPVEIAMVDRGGAGPGWLRTGGTFGVFRAPSDAPGLAPVCRFYGTPGIGPNSHFYAADPVECEQVKRASGWTYEGIGFYAPRPDAGGNCADGTPVYRSYNNGAARNDSNHRFTVDATVFARSAASGYQPEGVAMCAAWSAADREQDAIRLLRQASFGPTEAEVRRVAAMGAAAWVDEQLGLPATRYPEYPWMPSSRADTCVDDRTQPIRADSFCARDNYTLFPLQLRFFQDALAQILVTSGIENSRNYAMRNYQQMLADRAFGTYQELLHAVTVSPVMGDYLDMANNNKASGTNGTEPNENYGREVLQLFSIGTATLRPDGTRVLDAAGRPVATYDQEAVEGFSRVFTGWTYPLAPGVTTARNNNPRSYQGDMYPVAANHDTGTKRLLGSVVAPAGLSAADDLQLALRTIANHANVGPFLGRQLIQKLVTSDPTPEYVARVTAVFDNNGSGQRGDLRAVVRAVLLDREARGARKLDPGFGKLVEPALYATSMARALNARSDGVYLRAQSSALAQNVFYSPSVFNFYSPGYVVPATTLVGPEFGLLTSATAIGRANFANGLVYTTSIAADTNVFGATGTQADLSAYAAVAGDAAALVDRVDRHLLAGTLGAAGRAAILAAVQALPATDTTGRARAALYLAFSSPQYQVQR
jgi:uncharacterized protein (DUF1800 family)